MDNLQDIYQPPVDLFAKAMTREMIASHYKGSGLPKLDKEKLEHELEHHVHKLKKAVEAYLGDIGKGENPSDWLCNRILEFSADVGNCAMFYADSLGQLTLDRVEARLNEPDLALGGGGQYVDWDGNGKQT